MPGKAPDSEKSTGTGEVVPGHSHVSTGTTAQVVMIHIEATLDHDIGIIATTPGVAHDAQIPHTGVTAIDPTMTYNIYPTADHLCTETQHTTPEIEATHVHIQPTNPLDKIQIGHTHTPVDCKASHITRRTPE